MAISLVHQATGSGTSSPLSVTITAAASGNTLVVCVVSKRSSGAARTVSSITCTNTTGWTKLAASGAFGTSYQTEIWYGHATATSGTSVSITMSGTTASLAANVSEFSGILTSGTIPDGTAQGTTGSGPSVTTAAYSTAKTGDLVITCEGHADGTAPSAQPGGSFANLTFANQSTVTGVQGNYIVLGTSGSQSATWTIGSVAWGSVMGALFPVVTTPTKDHTTDTDLKAGAVTTTKTHTTDTLLRATVTKSQTVDTLLRATKTKTHTIDTILRSTVTKAQTLDTLLRATVTKAHTTDTNLATASSAVSKTHTVDTLLLKPSTKFHTADSLLLATQTKTQLTDTLLRATVLKAHTADTLLLKTQTKTQTTDTLLLKTSAKSHTTDTDLKGSRTKAHTVDSYLSDGSTPKTSQLPLLLVG